MSHVIATPPERHSARRHTVDADGQTYDACTAADRLKIIKNSQRYTAE